MEKIVKLDTPKDSFTLGKKGLTQVTTTGMSLRKTTHKAETTNADGSVTTTRANVVEASWGVSADGGAPRTGLRVVLALPADLATALEKFHDDNTKAAVASAD